MQDGHSSDPSLGTSATHPYTCLSCSLAFTDATFQRDHYATDLHRYNSKRRVAGLMPVSLNLFEEKIMQRKEVEVEESTTRLSCKACNKNFSSASTQATHNLSRKHKETVLRSAALVKVGDLTVGNEQDAVDGDNDDDDDEKMMEDALESATATSAIVDPTPSTSTSTPHEQEQEALLESSGDPKLDRLIAKRILSSPPIPTTTCLFCPHTSDTAVASTAHMRTAHSFLIPDEEYLVDLPGLLRRLGEEVGTWNVCVCCGKGYGGNVELEGMEGLEESEKKKRASKGVEAVRKHMQDKSHCKLRYDTDSQRLDLADFYDFRPSYPDYALKQAARLARREARSIRKEGKLKNGDGSVAMKDGWEDEAAAADGEAVDEEGMEVVYEEVSSSDSNSDDDDDEDEEVPGSEITYGDSQYELVLASGVRIGHRAHSRLHKQNLAPYANGANPFPANEHSKPELAYKPSPHSKTLLALVGGKGGMMKDRSHARPLHEAGLVRTKGGNVVQARNKGEAKEAQRDMRTFRELKSYNDFALVRGMIGNSQKHYRDHLLQ